MQEPFHTRGTWTRHEPRDCESLGWSETRPKSILESWNRGLWNPTVVFFEVPPVRDASPRGPHGVTKVAYFIRNNERLYENTTAVNLSQASVRLAIYTAIVCPSLGKTREIYDRCSIPRDPANE